MKFLKILLIDDDAGDRKIIARYLKKTEITFTIEEAMDVEAGMTLASNQVFDCVIIDYLMPGIDGAEGIKLLKKINPYLPIIMATGDEDPRIAVEVIKNGADDYLSKNELCSAELELIICRAIEKSRMQAQIEKQRESLENFSKILAHDLKNPIQTIIGFSELIQQDIAQKTYDSCEEMISHVIASAQRMNELIDALRNFSNLETSIMSSISLEEILSNVETDIARSLEESKTVITKENTATQITVDRTTMQLVFQNLILNSIKYCEQEPRIHISCSETEDSWIISLSDNGIGIDPQDAKKIFRPFIRLHPQSKYQGSGLGLSTCQKIIDLHHGNIQCLSNPDQGITMQITLPKNPTK